MHARRWLGLILVVGLIAGTGYMAYAAVTGGEYLVNAPDVAGCATPGDQYDWAYEAINYDIADDATLDERNADLDRLHGSGRGGRPGSGDRRRSSDRGLVHPGGERSRANGDRRSCWCMGFARTRAASSTTELGCTTSTTWSRSICGRRVGARATARQPACSSSAISGRSSIGWSGRSTLSTSACWEIRWARRPPLPRPSGTIGLRRSSSIRCIRDSATKSKRESSRSITTLHTRRPGLFSPVRRFMAGVDVNAADPDDVIARYDRRPMLLIHGTGDTQDLPVRTQGFFEGAEARGIPVDLRWCDGSGHNAAKGMPVDVCWDDYARWLRDFFSRAMG